jgi:membrane-bound serine protease (ClpP class)
MLPVNYTGLALIVLGMAFLVAEVFVPASGALGVGGVIAFVIGAVILVDTDVPGYGIPTPLIIALAVISALFVLLVVRMGWQARGRPVVSGGETLVGDAGEVLADFTGDGWARVRGEIWKVRSAKPLAEGARVRVTGIEGLTLNVEPQPTERQGGTS